MPKPVQILLAALVLLCSGGALADEDGHADEAARAEAHEHGSAHPDHAIALVGVYAAGFRPGEEVIHHGGAGVSFHTGIVPDELELEVAVKAVFAGEDHAHLPFEAALRIPFHLSESLFLSIGLGPVVALDLHDGHAEMAVGGGFGLELSYWYNAWGGIVLGAAYEFLFHDGVIHKVVAVAGPAFGW
jgi:hypothetical protein